MSIISTSEVCCACDNDDKPNSLLFWTVLAAIGSKARLAALGAMIKSNVKRTACRVEREEMKLDERYVYYVVYGCDEDNCGKALSIIVANDAW